MGTLTTAQIILGLILSVGPIVLAIDAWVHRLEQRRRDADYRLSGQASIQTKLDQIEVLRIERAARVELEIKQIRDEIEDMGRKMSDFGSAHQAEVLRVGSRLAMLEAQSERRRRS